MGILSKKLLKLNSEIARATQLACPAFGSFRWKNHLSHKHTNRRCTTLFWGGARMLRSSVTPSVRIQTLEFSLSSDESPETSSELKSPLYLEPQPSRPLYSSRILTSYVQIKTNVAERRAVSMLQLYAEKKQLPLHVKSALGDLEYTAITQA